MDYNIKLSNGQILKGFIQSPGEKTRAVILFIHGIGEHLNRYSDWSGRFNKEGIAFTGVDLPGHGRSDGRRGHIESFTLLHEMIDILLDTISKTYPNIPIFIYGHSLGGGIVLDYLLRKNPEVQGAIVTSPWLRLSSEPAKIKICMANAIRYILPGFSQPSGLIVDHISHDTSVIEKYRADPLVHDRISVSLLHCAMKAARYSLAHAHELKVPTLLIQGNDDQITSPEGSREFAARTKMAELKIWEGGYHELHNEAFKDEVFAFIMKWLNGKLE